MLITNVKPLPNVSSILNPHSVTIAFVNGQQLPIQKSMDQERNQKDLPVLNGKMVARLSNSETLTPHSKVCNFDHLSNQLYLRTYWIGISPILIKKMNKN